MSISYSLSHENNDKVVTPVNMVPTPKHSNCTDDKTSNIRITNPYVPVKVQHNNYNILENIISEDKVSIISPSPTEPPILTNTQRKRIEANKAQALAIRANVMKAQIEANKAAAYQRLKAREKSKNSDLMHASTDQNSKHSIKNGTNRYYMLCSICSTIVNPYISNATNNGKAPQICVTCVTNIQFTQEESHSFEDV
jgi:hypothetical protein